MVIFLDHTVCVIGAKINPAGFVQRLSAPD
jgi:hypothetical protein